jgi:hypothetical protein
MPYDPNDFNDPMDVLCVVVLAAALILFVSRFL